MVTMPLNFDAVEKLLREYIGLAADSVGRKLIERIVTSHMAHFGVVDSDDYLAILKNSQDKLDELIDQVVVCETWFFRDIEPFHYLKQYVLKKWLPKNRGNILRVLSAPCSTGEEPYSIAMTLLDAGLLPGQFHIDAVDISRIGIEKAQNAVYKIDTFRGKTHDYLDRYFVPTDCGYELNERITSLVRFYQGNMIKSDILAGHNPYHIVFCRNLVIYMTDDARSKILSNIGRLLVSDGILFTGHAELLFFRGKGYDPVHHPRSYACRKSSIEKREIAVRSYKRVNKNSFSVSPLLQPVNKANHMVSDRKGPVVEDSTVTTLVLIRDLADRGELEKAYALCNKYLVENRTNAEVLFLMGLLCHSSEQTDSAEKYFLKSLYCDPSHYEASVHLSLLYEQKGDSERCVVYKDRAKRIYEKQNIEVSLGSDHSRLQDSGI